jgi:hypothetical protein
MLTPAIRGNKRKLLGSIAASACLSAAVLQAAPASAITTWNWSFQTDVPDEFASGTFTTADVTPMAGVSYDILGISGTYSRGGSTYPITGLSTYDNAANSFQWDGTSISQILSLYNGIAFSTTGTPDVSMYCNLCNGNYGPIGKTFTDQIGSSGITSSTLSPVPGPLPILGGMAAYSWSRRLRKRITLHS